MLSLNKLRKDFPILRTGVIYLDSASSSLTPEPVLQKMLDFYHSYRANVGRGIHKFSQKASEEYEQARIKIAKFIKAKSEKEIVMTKNTTEGINLVAQGLKWKKENRIVISLRGHHSNFIVWLRARDQNALKIKFVKPKKLDKVLGITDFENAIDNETKLVA